MDQSVLATTPLLCLDCFSFPFGTAVRDVCGVCDGNNASCTACNNETYPYPPYNTTAYVAPPLVDV